MDAEETYEKWLTRTKEKIGAGMHVDKDKWIAKYNKEHSKGEKPTLDPEAAFNTWKVKAQREYAESVLERSVANKVSLKENNLSHLVQLIGQNFLTPLHSSIVVGIAPLVRYSQGRVRLSHLKSLQYIALHPLPALFRIETDFRARFTRWFFQLDTLLWGHYVHDDEQLAQIHLVTSASMKVQDDIVDLSHEWKMFPSQFNSDLFANASALNFSPTNSVETHIVLSIAVLQALVRRYETSRPNFLVSWDESHLSSMNDAKRVLIHLAFDIFPLVPNMAAPAQLLPTAVTALADILSRWAGYQLAYLFPFEDEDKWLTDHRELFAPQLYSIVNKCAKLVPNNAEHFYRLGALSCVIGKPDRALNEFRHAATLDRNCERVRPFPADAVAFIALKEAGWGQNEDLALARFAAHAARAIYSGGRSQVREAMQSSEVKVRNVLRIGLKGEIHPTIALVQKLLDETDTSGPETVPQLPVVIEPLSHNVS